MDDFDTRRWQRMAATITLDRAEPFRPVAGFDWVESPTQPLIETIRRWLHRGLEAGLQQLPAPSAHDLLADVRLARGEKVADRLRRWVLHVYAVVDRPASIRWNSLLTSACRKPGLWAEFGFPAPISDALREACLIATTTDWTLIDVFEGTRLTDWDLGIYAMFEFDDDENDPVHSLILVSGQWQDLHFWRQLASSVPLASRNEFVMRAERVAELVGSGVPLTWPAMEDWPE